jgi:Uncharacterized conserved protein
MKNAYPVVLSKDGEGYFVTIPDFDINTQGSDIADAMYMARDAIGLMGIDMEDDGKSLPEPGTVKAEKELEDDIITLVDVDFTEYRKKVDNRAVRKNCTIPYWLSEKAEKNSINYSRVLQDALIEILVQNEKPILKSKRLKRRIRGYIIPPFTIKAAAEGKKKHTTNK